MSGIETNNVVERLRAWAEDRRHVDEVTMAGQHPNTDLLDEAADLIQSLSDRIDELDWLGSDTRLSLEHYSPVFCDDGDQSVEWRVICQSGNINDREYHCVGRGETPFDALTSARASLTQGGKNAKSG